MENINTVLDLNTAIQRLEVKQAKEWGLLKEQAHVMYDKMSPANILKNSIKGLASTPDLKDELINTALSMAAGYISKKVAIGATHNPVAELVGTLLQIGVTGVALKNTAGVKTIATKWLTSLFNKEK